MVEDTANKGAEGAPDTQTDPTVNLKAEFTRKFENQASELAAIKQLLQSQIAPKPAAPAEPEVDVYDAQKYADFIANRVAQTVDTKTQKQAKLQSTMIGLMQEYPELQPGSELYQEAERVLQTMEPEERVTGAGYKAAVHEAALKQGIVPASRRKKQQAQESNDSFQLGGSKSTSQGKKGEELNPITQAWAELLGVNHADPKVKERLKQHSKKFGVK